MSVGWLPRVALWSALWTALCCTVSAAEADGGLSAVQVAAGRVTLQSLAAHGHRLTAVGERGLVMTSEDAGAHWRAQQLANGRMLNAVAFTPQGDWGVAVGHGGTVLRTEDGGVHWTQVVVTDAGRDALLGVTVLADGRFVACGAFGLYLVSSDQGLTWQRSAPLGDAFDRHFYQVVAMGDTLLLIGESGTLARSADGGRQWQTVASPYAGSFFGGVAVGGGVWVIYGMRGRVYRSDDDGRTWHRSEVDSLQAFNGGRVLPDGRIALAGNHGHVALSGDGGRTFRVVQSGAGNLAQLWSRSNSQWLAIGDTGVSMLDGASLTTP